MSASVLANYERTIRAMALAVGGDGTLYLLATAGTGKPVRLRTFPPR